MQGGLPAALVAKRYTYPEDAAAVSTAQQPKPKQHADGLTKYFFIIIIFLFFIHKEVGAELGTAPTWKAKLLKIQTYTGRVDLIAKRYKKIQAHTSSQTRRLPSSDITGPARAADPPPALPAVPAASPVRMLSRSPEVWELQARCSHWGLYKLVFREN